MDSVSLRRIISLLPSDEKELLRNCSLVAKSWKDVSQERLFASVRPDPGNLRNWVNGISGENAELLAYVRQLTCQEEPLCDVDLFGPGADETIHDRFRPFCRLEHLTLFCIYNIPSSPKEIDSFSAFKLTLLGITLNYCDTSKRTLVNLINFFPNFEHLSLEEITYIREEEDHPTDCDEEGFHRPLKKLNIRDGSRDMQDLLGDLFGLGLRSDEVVLGRSLNDSSGWVSFANHVISTFGATAKCLRLPDMPTNIGSERLTLSPCLELRELEVQFTGDPRNETDSYFIPTITSTKFQKIILIRRPAFNDRLRYDSAIDLKGILTKLGERPGCEFKLEKEFRGRWDVEEKEEKIVVPCLPRFSEKGKVTLWDHKGNLVYSSDGPVEKTV